MILGIEDTETIRRVSRAAMHSWCTLILLEGLVACFGNTVCRGIPVFRFLNGSDELGDQPRHVGVGIA